MFSQEQLNTLLKEVMGRYGAEQNGRKKNNNENGSKNFLNLTPSQMLVIAGILCGGLQIDSVLIDKDQEVQIVLAGSLKRKTDLEKVMDQIGTLPFDEVLKAMLGRF